MISNDTVMKQILLPLCSNIINSHHNIAINMINILDLKVVFFLVSSLNDAWYPQEPQNNLVDNSMYTSTFVAFKLTKGKPSACLRSHT